MGSVPDPKLGRVGVGGVGSGVGGSGGPLALSFNASAECHASYSNAFPLALEYHRGIESDADARTLRAFESSPLLGEVSEVEDDAACLLARSRVRATKQSAPSILSQTASLSPVSPLYKSLRVELEALAFFSPFVVSLARSACEWPRGARALRLSLQRGAQADQSRAASVAAMIDGVMRAYAVPELDARGEEVFSVEASQASDLASRITKALGKATQGKKELKLAELSAALVSALMAESASPPPLLHRLALKGVIGTSVLFLESLQLHDPHMLAKMLSLTQALLLDLSPSALADIPAGLATQGVHPSSVRGLAPLFDFFGRLLVGIEPHAPTPPLTIAPSSNPSPLGQVLAPMTARTGPLPPSMLRARSNATANDSAAAPALTPQLIRSQCVEVSLLWSITRGNFHELMSWIQYLLQVDCVDSTTGGGSGTMIPSCSSGFPHYALAPLQALLGRHKFDPDSEANARATQVRDLVHVAFAGRRASAHASRLQALRIDLATRRRFINGSRRRGANKKKSNKKRQDKFELKQARAREYARTHGRRRRRDWDEYDSGEESSYYSGSEEEEEEEDEQSEASAESEEEEETEEEEEEEEDAPDADASHPNYGSAAVVTPITAEDVANDDDADEDDFDDDDDTPPARTGLARRELDRGDSRSQSLHGVIFLANLFEAEESAAEIAREEGDLVARTLGDLAAAHGAAQAQKAARTASGDRQFQSLPHLILREFDLTQSAAPAEASEERRLTTPVLLLFLTAHLDRLSAQLAPLIVPAEVTSAAGGATSGGSSDAMKSKEFEKKSSSDSSNSSSSSEASSKKSSITISQASTPQASGPSSSGIIDPVVFCCNEETFDVMLQVIDLLSPIYSTVPSLRPSVGATNASATTSAAATTPDQMTSDDYCAYMYVLLATLRLVGRHLAAVQAAISADDKASSSHARLAPSLTERLKSEIWRLLKSSPSSAQLPSPAIATNVERVRVAMRATLQSILTDCFEVLYSADAADATASNSSSDEDASSGATKGRPNKLYLLGDILDMWRREEESESRLDASSAASAAPQESAAASSSSSPFPALVSSFLSPTATSFLPNIDSLVQALLPCEATLSSPWQPLVSSLCRRLAPVRDANKKKKKKSHDVESDTDSGSDSDSSDEDESDQEEDESSKEDEIGMYTDLDKPFRNPYALVANPANLVAQGRVASLKSRQLRAQTVVQHMLDLLLRSAREMRQVAAASSSTDAATTIAPAQSTPAAATPASASPVIDLSLLDDSRAVLDLFNRRLAVSSAASSATGSPSAAAAAAVAVELDTQRAPMFGPLISSLIAFQTFLLHASTQTLKLHQRLEIEKTRVDANANAANKTSAAASQTVPTTAAPIAPVAPSATHEEKEREEKEPDALPVGSPQLTSTDSSTSRLLAHELRSHIDMAKQYILDLLDLLLREDDSTGEGESTLLFFIRVPRVEDDVGVGAALRAVGRSKDDFVYELSPLSFVLLRSLVHPLLLSLVHLARLDAAPLIVALLPTLHRVFVRIHSSWVSTVASQRRDPHEVLPTHVKGESTSSGPSSSNGHSDPTPTIWLGSVFLPSFAHLLGCLARECAAALPTLSEHAVDEFDPFLLEEDEGERDRRDTFLDAQKAVVKDDDVALIESRLTEWTDNTRLLQGGLTQAAMLTTPSGVEPPPRSIRHLQRLLQDGANGSDSLCIDFEHQHRLLLPWVNEDSASSSSSVPEEEDEFLRLYFSHAPSLAWFTTLLATPPPKGSNAPKRPAAPRLQKSIVEIATKASQLFFCVLVKHLRRVGLCVREQRIRSQREQKLAVLRASFPDGIPSHLVPSHDAPPAQLETLYVKSLEIQPLFARCKGAGGNVDELFEQIRSRAHFLCFDIEPVDPRRTTTRMDSIGGGASNNVARRSGVEPRAFTPLSPGGGGGSSSPLISPTAASAAAHFSALHLSPDVRRPVPSTPGVLTSDDALPALASLSLTRAPSKWVKARGLIRLLCHTLGAVVRLKKLLCSRRSLATVASQTPTHASKVTSLESDHNPLLTVAFRHLAGEVQTMQASFVFLTQNYDQLVASQKKTTTTTTTDESSTPAATTHNRTFLSQLKARMVSQSARAIWRMFGLFYFDRLSSYLIVTAEEDPTSEWHATQVRQLWQANRGDEPSEEEEEEASNAFRQPAAHLLYNTPRVNLNYRLLYDVLTHLRPAASGYSFFSSSAVSPSYAPLLVHQFSALFDTVSHAAQQLRPSHSAYNHLHMQVMSLVNHMPAVGTGGAHSTTTTGSTGASSTTRSSALVSTTAGVREWLNWRTLTPRLEQWVQSPLLTSCTDRSTWLSVASASPHAASWELRFASWAMYRFIAYRASEVYAELTEECAMAAQQQFDSAFKAEQQEQAMRTGFGGSVSSEDFTTPTKSHRHTLSAFASPALGGAGGGGAVALSIAESHPSKQIVIDSLRFAHRQLQTAQARRRLLRREMDDLAARIQAGEEMTAPTSGDDGAPLTGLTVCRSCFFVHTKRDVKLCGACGIPTSLVHRSITDSRIRYNGATPYRHSTTTTAAAHTRAAAPSSTDRIPSTRRVLSDDANLTAALADDDDEDNIVRTRFSDDGSEQHNDDGEDDDQEDDEDEDDEEDHSYDGSESDHSDFDDGASSSASSRVSKSRTGTASTVPQPEVIRRIESAPHSLLPGEYRGPLRLNGDMGAARQVTIRMERVEILSGGVQAVSGVLSEPNGSARFRGENNPLTGALDLTSFERISGEIIMPVAYRGRVDILPGNAVTQRITGTWQSTIDHETAGTFLVDLFTDTVANNDDLVAQGSTSGVLTSQDDSTREHITDAYLESRHLGECMTSHLTLAARQPPNPLSYLPSEQLAGLPLQARFALRLHEYHDTTLFIHQQLWLLLRMLHTHPVILQQCLTQVAPLTRLPDGAEDDWLTIVVELLVDDVGATDQPIDVKSTAEGSQRRAHPSERPKTRFENPLAWLTRVLALRLMRLLVPICDPTALNSALNSSTILTSSRSLPNLLDVCLSLIGAENLRPIETDFHTLPAATDPVADPKAAQQQRKQKGWTAEQAQAARDRHSSTIVSRSHCAFLNRHQSVSEESIAFLRVLMSAGDSAATESQPDADASVEDEDQTVDSTPKTTSSPFAHQWKRLVFEHLLSLTNAAPTIVQKLAAAAGATPVPTGTTWEETILPRISQLAPDVARLFGVFSVLGCVHALREGSMVEVHQTLLDSNNARKTAGSSSSSRLHGASTTATTEDGAAAGDGSANEPHMGVVIGVTYDQASPSSEDSEKAKSKEKENNKQQKNKETDTPNLGRIVHVQLATDGERYDIESSTLTVVAEIDAPILVATASSGSSADMMDLAYNFLSAFGALLVRPPPPLLLAHPQCSLVLLQLHRRALQVLPNFLTNKALVDFWMSATDNASTSSATDRSFATHVAQASLAAIEPPTELNESLEKKQADGVVGRAPQTTSVRPSRQHWEAYLAALDRWRPMVDRHAEESRHVNRPPGVDRKIIAELKAANFKLALDDDDDDEHDDEEEEQKEHEEKDNDEDEELTETDEDADDASHTEEEPVSAPASHVFSTSTSSSTLVSSLDLYSLPSRTTATSHGPSSTGSSTGTWNPLVSARELRAYLSGRVHLPSTAPEDALDDAPPSLISMPLMTKSRPVRLASCLGQRNGTATEYAPNQWKLTSVDSFGNYAPESLLLTSGRWYWVVQIAQGRIHQIGCATPEFRTRPAKNGVYYGVGDDDHSWIYDGFRQVTYHGDDQPPGKFGKEFQWKTGDFIGIGLDFNDDTGTAAMRIWANGKSLGAAFTDIPCARGLYPALSVDGPGAVNFFMDPAHFGSSPLPAGYRPIHAPTLDPAKPLVTYPSQAYIWQPEESSDATAQTNGADGVRINNLVTSACSGLLKIAAGVDGQPMSASMASRFLTDIPYPSVEFDRISTSTATADQVLSQEDSHPIPLDAVEDGITVSFPVITPPAMDPTSDTLPTDANEWIALCTISTVNGDSVRVRHTADLGRLQVSTRTSAADAEWTDHSASVSARALADTPCLLRLPSHPLSRQSSSGSPTAAAGGSGSHTAATGSDAASNQSAQYQLFLQLASRAVNTQNRLSMLADSPGSQPVSGVVPQVTVADNAADDAGRRANESRAHEVYLVLRAATATSAEEISVFINARLVCTAPITLLSAQRALRELPTHQNEPLRLSLELARPDGAAAAPNAATPLLRPMPTPVTHRLPATEIGVWQQPLSTQQLTRLHQGGLFHVQEDARQLRAQSDAVTAMHFTGGRLPAGARWKESLITDGAQSSAEDETTISISAASSLLLDRPASLAPPTAASQGGDASSNSASTTSAPAATQTFTVAMDLRILRLPKANLKTACAAFDERQSQRANDVVRVVTGEEPSAESAESVPAAAVPVTPVTRAESGDAPDDDDFGFFFDVAETNALADTVDASSSGTLVLLRPSVDAYDATLSLMPDGSLLLGGVTTLPPSEKRITADPTRLYRLAVVRSCTALTVFVDGEVYLTTPIGSLESTVAAAWTLRESSVQLLQVDDRRIDTVEESNALISSIQAFLVSTPLERFLEVDPNETTGRRTITVDDILQMYELSEGDAYWLPTTMRQIELAEERFDSLDDLVSRLKQMRRSPAVVQLESVYFSSLAYRSAQLKSGALLLDFEQTSLSQIGLPPAFFNSAAAAVVSLTPDAMRPKPDDATPCTWAMPSPSAIVSATPLLVATAVDRLNPCRHVVGSLHRSSLHPLHALEYRASCGYASNGYGCDVCGGHGSGPVYHCEPCQFDCHPRCFQSSETSNPHGHTAGEEYDCALHEHPLKYTTTINDPRYSDGSFICNICQLQGKAPVYQCLRCTFDCHPHCLEIFTYMVLAPTPPVALNEIARASDLRTVLDLALVARYAESHRAIYAHRAMMAALSARVDLLAHLHPAFNRSRIAQVLGTVLSATTGESSSSTVATSSLDAGRRLESLVSSLLHHLYELISPAKHAADTAAAANAEALFTAATMQAHVPTFLTDFLRPFRAAAAAGNGDFPVSAWLSQLTAPGTRFKWFSTDDRAAADEMSDPVTGLTHAQTTLMRGVDGTTDWSAQPANQHGQANAAAQPMMVEFAEHERIDLPSYLERRRTTERGLIALYSRELIVHSLAVWNAASQNQQQPSAAERRLRPNEAPQVDTIEEDPTEIEAAQSDELPPSLTPGPPSASVSFIGTVRTPSLTSTSSSSSSLPVTLPFLTRTKSVQAASSTASFPFALFGSTAFLPCLLRTIDREHGAPLLGEAALINGGTADGAQDSTQMQQTIRSIVIGEMFSLESTIFGQLMAQVHGSATTAGGMAISRLPGPGPAVEFDVSVGPTPRLLRLFDLHAPISAQLLKETMGMLLAPMFTPSLLIAESTTTAGANTAANSNETKNAPSPRFIVLISLLFLERLTKLRDQETRLRARSRDAARDASVRAKSLAVESLSSLLFPPPFVHALVTFLLLHPVPSVCVTMARLLLKLLPFVTISVDTFRTVTHAYKSVEHAIGSTAEPAANQMQQIVIDLYQTAVGQMMKQSEAAKKRRQKQEAEERRQTSDGGDAPADAIVAVSPTAVEQTAASSSTSSTPSSPAPAAVPTGTLGSLLTVHQVMRVLSSDVSPSQLAGGAGSSSASSSAPLHGFLTNFIFSTPESDLQPCFEEPAMPMPNLKHFADLYCRQTPVHASRLYSELALYLNGLLQRRLAKKHPNDPDLKDQVAFLKAIKEEMKPVNWGEPKTTFIDEMKRLRTMWSSRKEDAPVPIDRLMNTLDMDLEQWPLIGELGMHEFVLHTIILHQFNRLMQETLHLFDLAVVPSPPTPSAGALAAASSSSSVASPLSAYATLHTSVRTDLLFSCKSLLFLHVKQSYLTTSLARSVQIMSSSLHLDTFRAQQAVPNQVGFNNVRKTIFGQFFKQSYTRAHVLCRTRVNSRAFNVAFIGLHASDAGGPYREALNDCVNELQSSRLPFFVPVPNAKAGTGFHRDCWVTRPYFVQPPPFSRGEISPRMKRIYLLRRQCYRFIGILMGLAIRSKYLLPLHLPPIVWRLLAQDEVTMKHVEEIDQLSCTLMHDMTRQSQKIKEKEKEETSATTNDTTSATSSPTALDDDAFLFDSVMSDLKFEATGADGVAYDLIPNGRNVGLTSANLDQYLSLLRHFRMHEFDAEVAEIRIGLTSVVPPAYLQLFTWRELQLMVVGTGTIDMDLLERMTTVAGPLVGTPTIGWFWQVLKTRFTPVQQAKFLTFVWGRATLPSREQDFERKMNVQLLRPGNDTNLPVSHTCFFGIDIPMYSSADILYEKLLYAVENCTSIDGDAAIQRRGVMDEEDEEDDEYD